MTLTKWSIVEEARANPSLFWSQGVVNVVRDGRQWSVRLTDVEGLVDLYMSNARVLALVGLDGSELARRRDKALASIPQGARFVNEIQTLAHYGLDASERTKIAPFVTQRARTGDINLSLAPAEIGEGIDPLYEGDAAGGELAEIIVRQVR